MEKFSIDVLKQVPKKSILKWIVFVGAIYALVDAVYMRADSRRLMLDFADISSGLMPKVMMHLDVPLVIGGVLLCLLFGKSHTISALALRTKCQIMWLVIGAVVFVGIIYMSRPSGIVDGYEIAHTLVVVALFQELIFRGLLFRWMDEAHLGPIAYLASGLAWGGLLGIRAIVVSGASAIGAVFPMALVGIVGGVIAALVYKKTDSLWLVIYLHAALALL